MKRTSLSFMVLVAGALAASSPVLADSLNVYVGYADNLRSSGFFPSPWLGDANVVSESSAAQSFDSGAVRIDNTGTTSMTITNFSVTLDSGLSPTVFNFWGALTIGAGQTGIFTQTFSYNFDSSDYGFLGGAPNITAGFPLGGCTNPADATQAALCAANAPVIAFSENGNALTVNDTGQVVNTFGYDFINGSTDGNESINWNLAGSAVTRSGTPEPSTILLLSSSLLAVAAFGRKRLMKR